VSNPGRLPAIALISLALLQIAVQSASLTKGIDYVVPGLIIDDSYYYLQTAWNTIHLGFPTFDGRHATNGVQLLWFLVVLLAALLAPSRTALVLATAAVCFLLNAACYLTIWKLGELAERPKLSLTMACLWALLSLGTGIYSSGMENSLHAFLLWLVAWQATALLVQVDMGQRPQLLGLTIALTLSTWTRIDTGLLSAVLYSYCLFRAFRSRSLRPAVPRDLAYVTTSTLVALSGLAVQLFAFRAMGGSWLPISLLVKSSWAEWDFDTVKTWVRLATCAILPAAGLALVERYQDKSTGHVALHAVWLCWLVGILLQLVPLAALKAHRFYFWYLSPLFVFSILAVSLIVSSMDNLVTRPGPAKVLRMTGATGWVLIVVVSFAGFVARLDYRNPLYETRYQASLWMQEHLPPDAICASWNAGQIGFFSERSVINLHGLVNNPDFNEEVLQGEVPLMDYLQDNDVEYIIDYDLDERGFGGLPLVKEFPIETGADKSIQISRLSR
jgi:hypothetical protein